MVEDAVIVDAVRTPMGRRNGGLSGWHPADLGAQVLEALANRNGLDPTLIDDVIVGCVMQIGAQGLNLGRNMVLAAGWPETVPATTIDRQCGSSQQAAHFAAQGIRAGAYELAVAAGVEVMSQVPLGSTVLVKDAGHPFPPSVDTRYADDGGLQPQGIGAELLAERWDLDRPTLDHYAEHSHHRAARARDEGRFGNEIVAVAERRLDRDAGRATSPRPSITADEGIGHLVDQLADLTPAHQEGGRITAGNSAQIADGAAAILLASASATQRLGLAARARFHTFAVVGTDPITGLEGAVPATNQALERAGLDPNEIDVFEVSESFAAVPLAWMAELGIDPERVNPNGGAVALGHPLGCSGARMLTTLVNELERVGGRFGLQVTCEAGGMANATIIERLDPSGGSAP